MPYKSRSGSRILYSMPYRSKCRLVNTEKNIGSDVAILCKLAGEGHINNNKKKTTTNFF